MGEALLGLPIWLTPNPKITANPVLFILPSHSTTITTYHDWENKCLALGPNIVDITGNFFQRMLYVAKILKTKTLQDCDNAESSLSDSVYPHSSAVEHLC